jgi:hypothetical protein
MSHYDLLTSLVLPLLAGVPLVLRRVLAGRTRSAPKHEPPRSGRQVR